MKGFEFETLSLNLLKTFCVFAESGKVEETAKRLQVTQASVSLQLKKLEDETGQTLFKTVGRKKILSTFARDLFQSIAPPINELELRLKEVSKTLITPENRILRIGCRQDLIKRITSQLSFPGQVIISGMNSQRALIALRDDEVDVAIVSDPNIKGDWHTKKLFVDQPVLIANPKILKAKKWESIDLDLLMIQAIAYKKPIPFLNVIVEKLGGKPQDLKIKLYCEDWLSIVDQVKRSPTWSVLPREYKNEFEGLTVIDIPSRIIPSSPVYCVYGKELKGASFFK